MTTHTLYALKPLMLAIAGVFVSAPSLAVTPLPLTPDTDIVDLSETNVIDATDAQYRYGISGNGSGEKFTSVILGDSLLIKNGEYNPDNTGGFSTAGINAQAGSTINVGTKDKQLSKLEIQNHGDSTLAIGIMAWRGRDTPLKDSHVNVNSDIVDINVSSNYWAYGLYTYNNTTDPNIAEEDRSSIIIDASKININVSTETEEQSVGIIAWSQAKVKLSADEINIKAHRIVNTRGDAIVEINSERDESSIVRLEGDIVFEYNGESSGTEVNATVDINLTNADSYWNGSLSIPYSKLKPSDVDKLEVNTMTLGLSNGAQWTPTKVMEQHEISGNVLNGVTNVALPVLKMDGGIINITGKDIDVKVAKMQGQGIVNLATDLKNGTSTGQFTVESAEGETALDVNLMNKDMSAELTSDDLDAETAQALLGNIGGENVKTSTVVKEGLTQEGFTTDKEGNTTSTGPNTLMQSTLELASSAPLALNRIMMNDVRKRLGDIRTTSGTHGAWARYDCGKLSGDADLENEFHTVQVGIDTVPTTDSARMGVTFSYTDSDAEYARGSADMKAYSLAMYGTKMFDNGMFVDVIGRMGTADTDLMVDGQYKGSMNNVALSLSGEMGWRFDLTDMVYVEPQAEVTYTYVNDDKVSVSTANYDIDAVNSLMGRVGFAAGLKCPSDKGNVYVRASAVHEFLGDSKITGVNGDKSNTYEIDGQDTWVEYGIGANFNVTKSTYVWADIERTTGGALDEDWRATVGMRYAF